MPVSRHRLRMKVIEGCFTGTEATEWLSLYLQSSGQFKSVSKEQVCDLFIHLSLPFYLLILSVCPFITN